MHVPLTEFGLLCFLEALYQVYLIETAHLLIPAGCDEELMRRWFCELTHAAPDLAMMKAERYISHQHEVGVLR